MIRIQSDEVEGLKRQLEHEYAREQELATMLDRQRANRLRLEGIVMFMEEKFKAAAPPSDK